MKNGLKLLLLGATWVTGCSGSTRDKPHAAPPGESPPAAGQAAMPDGTARICIRPEMLRDLRITTAKAATRTGGEGVAVLGELKVNEDAYAEVGSPIAARVVRVLASPGDAVRQGQALVELQSVELGKARADYISARAHLLLAQKTLERKRNLAGEQIAPTRELHEAEAETTAAEASLHAARTTLRALGLSEEDLEKSGEEDGQLVLRAPVSGTVLERNAVRGQMTDPPRTLYRIADLSRLWLTAHAFERDAVRVQTKTSARVTFPALPGRAFSGTVILIGQEVEVSSRTIPIRVEIANEDGLLRPGMSATAWLSVGDADSTVIAVPAASLQRLADGWSVFIPLDEKTFEIRAVGRGRDLGGEVEVLSGLRPEEAVVVDGAFLLKAEADKARGEGDHHEH